MNDHAWESAFESSEALRNDVISEAEALYRATGLTPAQLYARVVELEGALGSCLGVLEDSGEYPVTTSDGFDVLFKGKV